MSVVLTSSAFYSTNPVAPSAIRVSSPSPSPYSPQSISISSSNSRLVGASSSVPYNSTANTISLFFSSSPASYSDSTALPLLVLSLGFSLTASVFPSMIALRPVHKWRFPHSVFAWSPATLMTRLSSSQRSASLIPTGCTPGLLSSANILIKFSLKKA